jgi:hypothetical protein
MTYHLATKGKSYRDRVAWWRAHPCPRGENEGVPGRFMCECGPDERRRDALNDEEVGEWYHQASYYGGLRPLCTLMIGNYNSRRRDE